MGCGSSAKPNKGGASDGEAKPAGTANRDQDKKAAKEENKDFSQTMKFLTQVPLFKRLPKDQHPLLAAACVSEDFKSGKEIIKQGELGNEFFCHQRGPSHCVGRWSKGRHPQERRLLW